MTTKMIWESKIAVEMVEGWNDLQVENLLNALDEAVEAIFMEHEVATNLSNCALVNAVANSDCASFSNSLA